MQTITVKSELITPKMLTVLVDLFGNDWQDKTNYHHTTIKGLVSRGLVSIVPSNYLILTDAGVKWLVDNRYAIIANGSRISASTKQYRYEYIANTLRTHHIKKALELYNTDYLMLTGKNGVGTVDDLHNNVGRRCNIRNNDDFENRCHEILAEVVFYATPSIERQYLTVYIGSEEVAPDSDPYNIVAQDRLTNLY